MAKVTHVIARPGVGAWYVMDLEAVRRGAAPADEIGFLFEDPPVTPGFTAIRQPARGVLLQFILDDGQIAYGDCATTTFPGRAGRDKPITPDDLVTIVNEQVAPQVVGREVNEFRPNDNFLVDFRLSNGDPLSPATRYGLSQAFLDSAAKSNHVPMARILANEWNTQIATEPIPMNLQTGPDWQRGVDKIILRRGAVIHSRQPHNEKMFATVPEYLEYVRGRLQRLAPAEYKPTIHMGLYGLPGKIYGGDVDKIVDHLAKFEKIADPYPMVFGDVVEMPARDEQIEKMAAIRRGVKQAGIKGTLEVEEHCLTIDDYQAFLEAGAADSYKIRPLDTGNFCVMMDIAALVRSDQRDGTKQLYLTGSGPETENASRARVHLALATRVDRMLGSPGMGVDEAHSLMTNEMTRVFALVEDLGV